MKYESRGGKIQIVRKFGKNEKSYIMIHIVRQYEYNTIVVHFVTYEYYIVVVQFVKKLEYNNIVVHIVIKIE